MFKTSSSANTILKDMEIKLLQNQNMKETENYSKVSKAVDYLNLAAEIFDDTGLHKEAEEITLLLEKLGEERVQVHAPGLSMLQQHGLKDLTDTTKMKKSIYSRAKVLRAVRRAYEELYLEEYPNFSDEEINFYVDRDTATFVGEKNFLPKEEVDRILEYSEE